MMEDREPAENIGGAWSYPLSDSREMPPDSRTEAIIDRLGDRYWRKGYGGQDAFSCLLRTILSQNTSDVVSQPAFDALIDRYDGENVVEQLVLASPDKIAALIRPAGLHNQKARVIHACAETIQQEWGEAAAFNEFIRSAPYSTARERLLAMNGVGPKTADCVLLFAGGRDGVFPVDTHVHRITRRLGIVPPDADHETVRAVLEGRLDELDSAFRERWRDMAVPPEKCGFGHTAMIQFGREYCTARGPACLNGPNACPLVDLCKQVGVDSETGTVVDPRNAGNPNGC